MILMLFGAVAVAGVLGTGFMASVKGPGRTLTEVSKTSQIENAMLAATKLVVSGDAAAQDCDGDGTVEPLPFRVGAGPTGGGLVPLESGAVKQDPWGKALGYCVWDHGKKTVTDNVPECGGATAKRLNGGNVSSEVVLAIISAGKDGIFQTTCNAFVDANNDKIADTPLIVTAPGSDDIVRRDTVESLLASGALSQLADLPDEACAPGSEGTMRYTNGVPQVCTTTGWKEIGGNTANETTGGFTSVGPVNPGTVHISNTITTGGYFGTRKVTVDGGILVVNGVDSGSSANVPVEATVAIKGTAAAFPAALNSLAQTPKVFTLKIGTVSKTWTLTTRGRTAPVLVVTPNPSNNMNVSGPTGTPGTHTGTAVQFTVRNTGEAQAAAITAAPTLSNTTNFELTGTNLCSNFVLNGSSANNCTFYVRPKAATPGTYTSTLTVAAAGATSASTTLNGTASGWACTIPWGGTVNHGLSVTGYSASSVAWNQACTSVQGSRTCTNAVLNNPTFSFGACSVTAPLNCTSPWSTTVSHGTSITAYTQTAPAYSAVCSSYAATRSCTNGALSGSATNQYCYQWSVGAFGACSKTCGGGTQTRTVQCLRQPGGAVVADGNCGGTKPAPSQSCNTQSCCAGKLHAGYCWYMGALNQSCNTVCSARGGVHAATRNYVGSAGNMDNCIAVVDALGVSWNAMLSYADLDLGCVFQPNAGQNIIRFIASATNYATSGANSRRVCACNN
jgi:hypothetical protein